MSISRAKGLRTSRGPCRGWGDKSPVLSRRHSSIHGQASPFHLGFVMNKLSLRQIFSEHFGFSRIIITALMLRTHW